MKTCECFHFLKNSSGKFGSLYPNMFVEQKLASNRNENIKSTIWNRILHVKKYFYFDVQWVTFLLFNIILNFEMVSEFEILNHAPKLQHCQPDHSIPFAFLKFATSVTSAFRESWKITIDLKFLWNIIMILFCKIFHQVATIYSNGCHFTCQQ